MGLAFGNKGDFGIQVPFFSQALVFLLFDALAQLTSR